MTSNDELRAHYEVEKELAATLRNAPAGERRKLYPRVYDELFRRVPSISHLARTESAELRQEALDQQLGFLNRFLENRESFLEIGAGDCALASGVARRIERVYAVDVSAEITGRVAVPQNVRLVLSDGVGIPVESGTIDVAYSNQLMEHLHPDDASEQLKSIYTALAPGGVYVCITPNRLNGPHDVSKHFDRTATGLHLKEYSGMELRRALLTTRFRRCHFYIGARQTYIRCPVWLFAAIESIVATLPFRLRRRLLDNRWGYALLGVRIAAVK